MHTDPSIPDHHDSAGRRGDDESPATADRSRRRLLGAIGAGLGAAVALPAAAAAQNAGGNDGGGDRDGDGRDDQGQRADRRDGESRDRDGRDGRDGGGPDRFDRLFDLPPFAEPSEELRRALVEIGRPGGILDAGDPLDVGPIRLITEPELTPNNRDNSTHTAGVTFLGQFIDHDLTRDAGSRLGQVTPVRRSTNLRTARFDLDSVYGGGPEVSPELYDGFRFRVESGGLFEDLPRDDASGAIIGDPRNDENLIISGLHAAFLLFHNAVLDGLASGTPTADDFATARQTVQRHYQWIVVNEVLPQFVGRTMIDDIVRSGRQVFLPDRPRIPLEFQTAVYRFGHSMIRPSYRANLAGDGGEPFFAFVFDPDTFGEPDPEDLSGEHRAARRFIGWQTFFDFGDGEVKPNKRIDTALSTPLFQLPTFTIPTSRGEDLGPTSLATRNLLRHITWEIPSGQAIAAEMGVAPLSPGDLSDIGGIDASLAASTPLFLYILREADVVADGLHLGPVGGRITAEVFLGLLDLDPTSYRNTPGWRPTLPQRSGSIGDDFTMVDLLTIAGVDPTSRGQ